MKIKNEIKMPISKYNSLWQKKKKQDPAESSESSAILHRIFGNGNRES